MLSDPINCQVDPQHRSCISTGIYKVYPPERGKNYVFKMHMPTDTKQTLLVNASWEPLVELAPAFAISRGSLKVEYNT